jgi:hypothetical protein
MAEIIKGGGSVMVGGRIIDSINDLPSEVDLAKGDASATQSVRKSLEETKANAERELAKLDQEPAKTDAGDAGDVKSGSDDAGKGGEPTVIDLDTLTVAQLKEVADERKVSITADMKKADIVAAIRAESGIGPA